MIPLVVPGTCHERPDLTRFLLLIARKEPPLLCSLGSAKQIAGEYREATHRERNRVPERSFSAAQRTENRDSPSHTMRRTLILLAQWFFTGYLPTVQVPFPSVSPGDLLSFAMLPPEQQTQATIRSSRLVFAQEPSTKAFLRRSQPGAQESEKGGIQNGASEN